jgi:hypothetical protein
MTERTVQKITKVIRGTSRSESRSKKNRESSLSPKGLGKEDSTKKAAAVEAVTKKTATTAASAISTAAATAKDDKKSAVEKRKEFQTHKISS